MKQLLYFFLLLLSVTVTNQTIAQKQTTHFQQTWIGYFNQTRFSDKWGLWVDAHLRTKEDFFTNFSQAIGRAGLTYYVNDHFKFTAGYAYINHFPQDNHKEISQPEHRPWQQVQWHQRAPKLRIMQWVRLEERFRRKILNDESLAEGYNFNYKLRYNFFLNLPLSEKAFAPKSLSFVVNDEVHINFGKEITYNYFDQNRFFLGFNYHLNQHENIQFGYMNLFQQLAAGNRYRNLHTMRVFYFQNLDLRKKNNHH